MFKYSLRSRPLTAFALATLLGGAASAQISTNQALSPQVKKSIDAQAFAFSGRHCTGKYVSKPSRAIPAGQFPVLVKLLDESFQQLKSKHPELTFRSDNNGKDLYRGIMGDKKEMRFTIAYLTTSQLYVYGCVIN